MTRRDKLILSGIVALATALRLVGLPGRGEWDDDQGRELLAMLRWVRDGDVPLLGPVSSNDAVHHGVGYYWILAPSAFSTDVHPLAAVITIALIGIGGVAAAWWLGWTVGGPVAGHVTGMLMAVSPTAISASTFVWNANIVAPGAALAVAAAWHAWRTRRARWWLLSAVGGLVMLSGHLLAAIAGPPLLVLLVADVLRRAGSDRLRMLAPTLGAVAIVAAVYVPALIFDVRHGLPQTHAIVNLLSHTGDPGGPAVSARLGHIPLRVLSWPLSGFAGSAPFSGWPAAVVTAAAVVVAAMTGQGVARHFGLWAAATVIWALLALSVLSPGMATPFVGLPDDQYHTWLDPILLSAIGLLAVRLHRAGAAVVVASCIALALASFPPVTSPDGGWPRADQAAARIRSATGDHPTAAIAVRKSGAALEFPLRRQRGSITQPSSAEFLVVTCDPLFFHLPGLACGGPAEEASAADVGFSAVRVVDRFTDSPRRVVTVFTNH